MKHLTVDEIIAFVSFSEINKETLAMAAEVNSHILKCTACREKVKAYTAVHEKIVATAQTQAHAEAEVEAELEKTQKKQM